MVAARRLVLSVGLVLSVPAARAQLMTANCKECHVPEARLFAASVHAQTLHCPECHGGKDVYEITRAKAEEFGVPGIVATAPASRPAFDHGDTFRGRPKRSAVPVLCGTCHADVQRMNPYGFRTDELAQYWVSGHGQRLRDYGDDTVAVCIDCHHTHDILRPTNAESPTFFRNIPQTCGRCHANTVLMTEHGLPPQIPDQYRHSIHGEDVLEHGDSGAPNCATCHGAHGAAPPGFADVGHVCGRCHQQVDEDFMKSVHGAIPVMAPCIGCHAPGGDLRNHQIQRAAIPPEKLIEVYNRVRGTASPADMQAAFVAQRDALPGLRIDLVCANCHGPGKHASHAEFFETSDQLALARGPELARLLHTAEFHYAQTAQRVAEVGHGVLLVRDEALQTEEAKTDLVALDVFLHTLDPVQIDEHVQKIVELARKVNASLDHKENGLAWRRFALWVIWAFIVVFGVVMYRKYVLLKHAYVHTPGTPAPGPPFEPGRRRVLNIALSAMGAAMGAALLWPAIAYIWPARRRGGGLERVSAGKEAGWAVWEGRKVAVAGKPASRGFRRFARTWAASWIGSRPSTNSIAPVTGPASTTRVR
jgi:hypothetical protein